MVPATSVVPSPDTVADVEWSATALAPLGVCVEWTWPTKGAWAHPGWGHRA